MTLEIRMLPGLNVPMVMASPKHSQADASPLLPLLSGHHASINKQLVQYGAVVFRGFACDDADNFSTAIALCGLGTRCDASDYESPRTVFPNGTYTSSDLPPHIPLPLHHEKPRSKNPPTHLYFCCVTPAEKWGGTLFANAELIWLDLAETIRDKIIEHGIVYKQFFHGRSLKSTVLRNVLTPNSAKRWSEHFGTENKQQIEKKLTEDKLNWEWINKGNDLIVTNPLPGAIKHPITKQLSWFNSSAYLNYYLNPSYGNLKKLPATQYLASRYLIAKDSLPMVCHYGNGQAFSEEEIIAINQVIQHHTRIFNWQKGDFMIVDNYTFMHGKQAHQGNRLLYSCMTYSG